MAKSRARKLADIIVGAGIDINGNLTFDGGSTSADLTFADNDKANFGDASDLQIYHDGSHSYIEDASGTGNLKLRTNTLRIENAAGTELCGLFIGQGAASLYYDNSAKLATFSGGVSVTGQVNATTMHLVDGSTGLQLGNSNDTKFFHDGSNTKITHSGSGGFYIGADTLGLQTGAHNENYLTAAANGAVSLYYDNAAKLATTSTGIDVTGTVTADGLTVDAALATINAPSNNADLILTEGGTNTDARIRNSNGILEIDADLNNEFGNSSIMFAVDGTDRLKIDRSGDISFYEDTGTTAKLFWDSSAERLGLGTTTPAQKLDIRDGTITSRDATNTNYAELDRFVGLTLKGNGAGTRTVQTPNSDALTFGTNNTERMRITSTGNVGIGDTGDADALLDIDTGTVSANPGLRVRSNHGGQAFQQLSGTSFYWNTSGGFQDNTIVYGASTNSSLKFTHATGSAFHDRLTINSSGNVGIGTTSPTTKLSVETPATDATNNLHRVDLGIVSPDNGNASGYAASGMRILGQANNSSGDDHTVFLEFNTRDPSLNGSHGTSGFMTLTTPDSQGTYGTGQFDFYLRNSAPYSFPNDPQTSSSYWMPSLMTIKSTGNVGIGTTNPTSKLHLESGNAHNKLSITSTASGGTGYDAVIDLLGSAANSECAINMGINGDADREAIKTYQSAMTFRTNGAKRLVILNNGGTEQYAAVNDARWFTASSAFNNPTINLFTGSTTGASYPQTCFEVTMYGNGVSANEHQVFRGGGTFDYNSSSSGTAQNLTTYTNYHVGNALPATPFFLLSGNTLQITCNRQTNYDFYRVEVRVWGRGFSNTWGTHT